MVIILDSDIYPFPHLIGILEYIFIEQPTPIVAVVKLLGPVCLAGYI